MLSCTDVLFIIFITSISNIFTSPKGQNKDDVHLHFHLPEEQSPEKSPGGKTVAEHKEFSETDNGPDYIDSFLASFDLYVKADSKFGKKKTEMEDGEDGKEEAKVCTDKEDCKKWLANFCSKVKSRDYQYGDWFLDMFDILVKAKPNGGPGDPNAI